MNVDDVIDKQEKFESAVDVTEGSIVGKCGVRIGVVDVIIDKHENIGSVVTGTDDGSTNDVKDGSIDGKYDVRSAVAECVW